jgi:hypothetical protein
MTKLTVLWVGPSRVTFSPGEVLMMVPKGVSMFLNFPVSVPVTGNPQLEI